MPDAPVLLAGRYRLGASLGRGGMGQVLLARDETLERDVAIKEIDQPFGADGGASARRTLREARASARINHPNVVQVYDVLQLDDRTWIVMEYVPSRSLREEIAEQGRLDPYRVARIGLELLGALRTAHRLGVEHRDVKPANVLLADDGRVLLTDFGIAAVDDDAVISRSDILVGSPQFMAPERAQGRPSGPEADLWSLGATLYAAIEGRSPYERGSTMATLTALATEEPDPPVHAGVLRPLLDGLLRKDPATRMTAEDAESLARAVINGLSTSGDPTAGQQTKPSGLAGFAASFPAVFRIPRPRSSNDGSTGGSGSAGRARGAASARGSAAAEAAGSNGLAGGSAPATGGSAGPAGRRTGRRTAAPDVEPKPGPGTGADGAPGAKTQPAASSAPVLPPGSAAEPGAEPDAVAGRQSSAGTESKPEPVINPAGPALESEAAREAAAGSGVGAGSEAAREAAAGSGVGAGSEAAREAAAGSGVGAGSEAAREAAAGSGVGAGSEAAREAAAGSGAEPGPAAVVGAAVEPDPEAAGGPVSRPGAEPEPEAAPGAALEPEAAEGPGAEPEPEATPGAALKPDAAERTVPELGTDPKPEAAPGEPGVQLEPNPAGEAASRLGAVPKTETVPGAAIESDSDAAGGTPSRPGAGPKPGVVLGAASGPDRRTKSDSTPRAPVEMRPESEPDTRVAPGRRRGGGGGGGGGRRGGVPEERERSGRTAAGVG